MKLKLKMVRISTHFYFLNYSSEFKVLLELIIASMYTIENLMSQDNEQDEVVIRGIQYADVFDEKLVKGVLTINLYELRVSDNVMYEDEVDHDDNYIECDDDSFLKYVINAKQNISKEK